MNETLETKPNTDSAKQWSGWGTALKPASEHWILVRKKCSEKTVAANVLKHGTGGINIDACRISTDELTKTINPSPLGRFPANLVLDEVAAEMLDEQSGLNNVDNIKPHVSVGDDGKSFRNDSGGASRFFYVAKASKAERNAGLEGMPEIECRTGCSGAMPIDDLGKERDRFAKKAQNHHPTVKSTKLMQYLITLITPPNGIVLDPFMGSGSTGVAAKNLGFEFVGIEKEREYFEISEKRCGAI